MNNIKISIAITLIVIINNVIIQLTNGKTIVPNKVDKNVVIIVGAGSSGIAAATKLIENDLNDIIILEAENRIGGRVYTREFGNNNNNKQQVIEMGAQWCHGEKHNVVYELAAPYALLEHSNELENIHYIRSNGCELPDTILKEVTEQFLNLTSDSSALEQFEGTLGEYFQPRLQSIMDDLHLNKSLINDLIKFYELFYSIENAYENWNQESAIGYAAYTECEGSQTNVWPKGRGYRTIFDILMKKYPDPANDIHLEQKILFNKTVKRIIMENNSIRVITEDDSEYTGDKVIVTVSLGVLKDRYKQMFEPALPAQKQLAIQTLFFGTVNKIYLEFETKWWPDNNLWHGINIINIQNFNDDPQFHINSTNWLSRLMGIYMVPNVPNLLCGWISESYRNNFEHITDDQMELDIVQYLERLMNNQFKISKLNGILRTRWYSNPNFRGTWSFHGKIAQQLNITNSHLAEPIKNADGKNTILFAGEATHDKHFSTVHGAIESGWRAAQEIIDEN